MYIKDWTTFKGFADDRNRPIQWIDIDGHYYLSVTDGPWELQMSIKKTTPPSSDQTDFENNYKTAPSTNSTPKDKEYVMQAVREGKSFTVTTDLTSIASSETAFLYLKNPSASGKDVLITHFKFGTDSANTRTLIRIYANPTVTADGTALTEINTIVKSSPPTSSIECFKLPTVTSNGDRLNLDISPANSSSKGLNRWYWLEPGNSLLLTADNSQNNVDSFADVYWLEGI